MFQHYKLTTREELIDKFHSEFNDIVAIYGAWLGFHLLGGMKGELIDHLPDTLRVIAICSVGHEQYDHEKLAARGIQLYNTPSLGAEDVGDTVLWHILESFRFFKRFETRAHSTGHVIEARRQLQTQGYDHLQGKLGVETDQWLKNAFPFGEYAGGQLARSPFNKTCGIIGLGRIGQCIAKRVQALGMRVVYTQRNENKDSSYTYEPELEELCKQSDVLVISCPGNDSTRNLVSRDKIDLLPPGCKVINVGRGFVIDESYAIERLQQGKIAWIGLDVYTHEPAIDPRLLNRCDVSLTPHMASSTKENFDATARYALANIWSVVVDAVEGRSKVV